MRYRLGFIGTLFLGALILGLAPAGAQQSWPDALGNCLKIFGSIERLACYDRLAHAIAGPVASAPSAAVDLGHGDPPAAELFGSENLPRGAAPGRVDTITSQIQNFSLSPGGGFIVILANGQSWRQMESDHTTARFHPGRTRTVTIARGAFGSYNLAFNDRSVEYKVVRIH